MIYLVEPEILEFGNIVPSDAAPISNGSIINNRTNADLIDELRVSSQISPYKTCN